MPEKKKRRATSVAFGTERRGQSVILEEMRAQNRATIEAVEASRVALEGKIDRADRESRERDALLELTVRGLRKTVEKNSDDIQQNSADIRQNSADIRQNTTDIKQNSADIKQNSADIKQNSADIRQNTSDLKQNSADIKQHSVEIRRLRSAVASNGQDIRSLTARVDVVGTLDQRLTALERPSSE
jgi:methyl-accepting chemotaxis protein